MGKALVIDADVAQSSSWKDHPRSTSARELLELVIRGKHKIVLSPEIEAEWDSHASTFATRWLAGMTSRRKVYWIENAEDPDLRRALEKTSIKPGKKSAIFKDVHLVEAAFLADQIGASFDEKLRTALREAAVEITELQALVWVSPLDDGVMAWIQNGGALVNKRKLGAEL